MKYKVNVQEIVSEMFEVEAGSEKEALEIAEKMYKKGNFVLEPGNLLSVEFTISNLQEVELH